MSRNARVQKLLLRSAARTATIATSSVTNAVAGNTAAIGPMKEYAHHTARFYLDVTVASGTGGLTFQLRAHDRFSGKYVVIFADASAITATGTYVFEFGPSIAAASTGRRGVLDIYLPVEWDVNIAVGDASSYTYSLSVELTS